MAAMSVWRDSPPMNPVFSMRDNIGSHGDRFGFETGWTDAFAPKRLGLRSRAWLAVRGA